MKKRSEVEENKFLSSIRSRNHDLPELQDQPLSYGRLMVSKVELRMPGSKKLVALLSRWYFTSATFDCV